MDINIREKEKLFELAVNNQKINCYTKRDDLVDTYFVEHITKEYCMEYGFESLPELRSQLKDLWKEKEEMDEVIKVCSVAAFKNRAGNNYEVEEKVDSENEEVLPAFIYNF